jgi:hypothetical protein
MAVFNSVTAKNADNRGILLRLILPNDATVVVEVKSVDDVRERRDDIH